MTASCEAKNLKRNSYFCLASLQTWPKTGSRFSRTLIGRSTTMKIKDLFQLTQASVLNS